ncbi:MAG TPA: VanZ family protein [Verrucomicrobiae bacterium]|nr:VanZ family protein [Verrucomicrobiae bacterium]
MVETFSSSHRTATPWRRALLLVVVLITLWAGLDPKDYRFHNEVEWLPNRPGIHFGKYGRVQTEPLLVRAQAEELNRTGFTLELAFTPAPISGGGFQVLASFHSGEDASQLVIGQWRDQLIVMNGDDYAHRRRLLRVTADTSLFEAGPLWLTVTATTNGTRLYLNGEQVAANAKLQLKLPGESNPARLALGNSVHTSQSWPGELSFFALRPQRLTDHDIEERYQAWRANGERLSDPATQPLLLFRFDEGGGSIIRNHGSIPEPLTIPPRPHALGARALAHDLTGDSSDQSLALDVALNFAGFLPFGVAFALVARTRRRGWFGLLLVTTLAGCGLSLFIELGQAWIPSRDSSLRDLVLNTAGAAVGAGLLLIVSKVTGRALLRR